ncbi:hypothetical protein [Psychrobium sp. 1_MG-2023]|uniref:hypothetical protein n=1 Tax=Psychrobium sp. 1_MG-2023 TaxID=3062624 RepID=UPI000C32F70D|nr:hypothetical protein [Psychrobium sp. 1_MG-2023]MDP2562133.1 hypothetical protein [Psychrobium sp. 1_MG-2023]PKF57190.1 hypothetical protein CW748_07335 [Alteromonadales bacterium alter-6D02]
MSSLRERVADRRNLLVSRSNSCIPKTLSEAPFEYAVSLFKNSINNLPEVEKISIIDPYVKPIDLDNLTSLFGGSRKINLEILSKFNSVSGEEEKVDRKIKINDRKEYLIKNGLFGSIELIHSKESMHDRYYIYWSKGAMIRVFFIGGSIGQRFDDYIGIIEISDKFMLNNISTYYDKLVFNKIDYLKV